MAYNKAIITPKRVLFVQSKGKTAAVTRLSLIPLCEQLNERGIESFKIHPKHGIPKTDYFDCIVFQFNDYEAISELKKKSPDVDSTVICIGGDVYSLNDYLKISDLVDYFLVPTDLHNMILSAALPSPVYTLPETIDFSLSGKFHVGSDLEFPMKSSKRICWFGYAESFEKGMASLIPAIQMSLEERYIDSFTLILNTNRFNNRYDFDIKEFSVEKFANITSQFDYALLSHFPLDLHVNSLIKSPNKAITSFFSGLIPIVSATPNYKSLFNKIGLESLTFKGPSQLYALLSRLDPARDSNIIRESDALGKIYSLFGESSISDTFIRHYHDFYSCYRNSSEVYAVPRIHDLKARSNQRGRDYFSWKDNVRKMVYRLKEIKGWHDRLK